jgi:hypothetical protein
MKRPVIGCLPTGSNKRIAGYRVVQCSRLQSNTEETFLPSRANFRKSTQSRQSSVLCECLFLAEVIFAQRKGDRHVRQRPGLTAGRSKRLRTLSDE